MDSRKESILKTLLYADIFDYPLKKQEIFNFLISNKKISKKGIFDSLKIINIPIYSKEEFFYLKKRENLIQKRKQRERISVLKIKKAKKIIKIISFIPSVKFIGISGGLAMNNSDKNDDIDIFVITAKDLVWTTRFFLVIFLLLLGVYRRRKSKNYSDKICLNMLLDERKMLFKSQDLYTAHELVQLVPVFNRDGTYQKFIKTNQWVKNLIPNALVSKEIYIEKKSDFFSNLFVFLFKLFFLEKILKFIETKYMEKHITKETIENNFLGLHPFDYKNYILRSYGKKLESFGLGNR